MLFTFKQNNYGKKLKIKYLFYWTKMTDRIRKVKFLHEEKEMDLSNCETLIKMSI